MRALPGCYIVCAFTAIHQFLSLNNLASKLTYWNLCDVCLCLLYIAVFVKMTRLLGLYTNNLSFGNTIYQIETNPVLVVFTESRRQFSSWLLSSSDLLLIIVPPFTPNAYPYIVSMSLLNNCKQCSICRKSGAEIVNFRGA